MLTSTVGSSDYDMAGGARMAENINARGDLAAILEPFEQQHLLQFWDQLESEQRERLAGEILNIDFAQVRALARGDEQAPDWEALAARAEPPPAVHIDGSGGPFSPEQAQQRGEAALRNGEVGMVLVAGGQGTRLGFPHPKGMFPLGPLSERPLFQLLIDQLLARAARHQIRIPLFLMTSPATHDETVAYFAAHDRFGLAEEDLTIFCQGTMPAIDAATGKLLLAEHDRLFLSPDGHGGMVSAFARHGCLEHARQRGLKHLYYCQIDNPLAQVCDPTLLGYHLLADSDMTTQVVRKQAASERVGNVVSIDDQVRIIEYSDLPPAIAARSQSDGSLKLWAGNIAIHVFHLEFLAQMVENSAAMPFHLAHKSVPHMNDAGLQVTPEDANAIKFERFIFDLLPWARNAIVVEGNKAEVFAPVKNKDGSASDTPTTSRQAMIELHQAWLHEAGVAVDAGVTVEINPRFALDADELRSKLPPQTTVTKPTYFCSTTLDGK